MKKIIKLALVATMAVFLSACFDEEEAVKAEQVTLSPAPVLTETDMMPSNSK